MKKKKVSKTERRKKANKILAKKMQKHIEKYSGVGKIKFKPKDMQIGEIKPGSAAYDTIQAICNPQPDYLSHCLKSLCEPIEYTPEAPVEKPPHEP